VTIDTRAALAVPGVLAVMTGKEMLSDGLAPLPLFPLLDFQADLKLWNSDGAPLFLAPHYALATDQARYAGEAVAVVIAETVAAAKDGAECCSSGFAPRVGAGPVQRVP
jgi:carbon-monoxide dehydrogenase large subunit